MRSISPALKTAQEATSVTPYKELVFTSKDGNTTYDYASRLLELEYAEEPYNDHATLILDNSDLAVVDITGYYVDMVLGAGGTGATYPRLWVKSYLPISMEGKLKVILWLEGVWAVLREQLLRLGNPPYYTNNYTTKTIYDILEIIIETELAAATGFSFTLDALGDGDDGIIDGFVPIFQTNLAPFDDMASVISSLMAMTKCYLRVRDGLAFKVVYPLSGTTPDVSYYSYKAHYFYEYTEKYNLLIPNHIIVYANAILDANYNVVEWDAGTMITAESEDTDQQAKYMEVIDLYAAPTISTPDDADKRAVAIMTKIKAEQLSGRVIVPHDCSVELYDNVRIYDKRGQ